MNIEHSLLTRNPFFLEVVSRIFVNLLCNPQRNHRKSEFTKKKRKRRKRAREGEGTKRKIRKKAVSRKVRKTSSHFRWGNRERVYKKKETKEERRILTIPFTEDFIDRVKAASERSNKKPLNRNKQRIKKLYFQNVLYCFHEEKTIVNFIAKHFIGKQFYQKPFVHI